MPHPADPRVDTAPRARLWAAAREDEAEALARCQARLDWYRPQEAAITETAARLAAGARARLDGGGVAGLLRAFDLGSPQGLALMSLAEALLRVPDAATMDALIEDKVAAVDWSGARAEGMAGLLRVALDFWARGGGGGLLRAAGRPVARQAARRAMGLLGGHFVFAETIGQAVETARRGDRALLYSVDMLGEAARTRTQAEHYARAYRDAIDALGAAGPDRARMGISIKLSALHPRFDFAQHRRVMDELVPVVADLVERAAARQVPVTIDAEEVERLDLTLDVLDALLARPVRGDGTGLGLAVQAYQKACLPLINHVADVARTTGRRLHVRLVKGAYWDAEVKAAQVAGHDTYPVYTTKAATDLSYLAAAGALWARRDVLAPAFATHNAHTVAAILALAGPEAATVEFQRLHGMGAEIHAALAQDLGVRPPCRIYCPVGSHEDLLPYLVRRLLENGANSSFVRHLGDADHPVAALARSPLEVLADQGAPLAPPGALYGAERANSPGPDLSAPDVRAALMAEIEGARGRRIPAASPPLTGPVRRIVNPARLDDVLAEVRDASAADIARAIAAARRAQPAWDARGGPARAAILERAAEGLIAGRGPLLDLLIREAGKTIPDAVAEWREAIDFLRYYAARARAEFGAGEVLAGPTGEHDLLSLRGRGVFVCISPWNFPLAIFLGQVGAALAAGNAVLAKPAEQTPLIAAAALAILREAGVPEDALHLLPGAGETVGAALVAAPGIDGVTFTGSTATARAIQRALADRDGPILPLIAETGGVNAMIVDASALPEQVARDVVASAFRSAGQRCSALRVLAIQEDVADRMIAIITGAMEELTIGDPGRLETDVGPLIDGEARAQVEGAIARLEREGRRLAARPRVATDAPGHFVTPAAFEIAGEAWPDQEIFGPVLQILRFKADALDALVDRINASGHGLTLGVHSRVGRRVAGIVDRARVGNIYVNRNQIGAVVGVQPFGGEGLSGTGPKAGGPRYLHRFAVERSVSTDTTAIGGNVALLSR